MEQLTLTLKEARYPETFARVMLVRDRVAEGPGPRLEGSAGAAELVAALLKGEPSESVVVLALDARRRVLEAVRVSQGTLTQSMAHPREIFRVALMVGTAAAVIVAHNHPSGDVTPSPDDHRLTRQLREAGDVLGIPVLDHVIVGPDGPGKPFFSYAAEGWPR